MYFVEVEQARKIIGNIIILIYIVSFIKWMFKKVCLYLNVLIFINTLNEEYFIYRNKILFEKMRYWVYGIDIYKFFEYLLH